MGAVNGSTQAKARARPAHSLNRLTATEIVRAIAAGDATCEAVVRDCLERIDAREKDIHAWASIEPELALRQARALDRAPARGPLHGVPIGVKDIIDTADLPTEMGSPIYRGHRPTSDAACVALTRAAGAVILGKTVTCEFAGMAPGATTNPHNVAHTPGGSSSGSGAAVADFMAPVAFGTQTGGSVLRPAAYCGVFGFKPTFGAFNRRGVYPAAESLDTIGLFARSIDDIELLSDVLELRTPSAPAALERAPRVGLCRTPLWSTAQPETVAALEDAAERLGKAGAQVREIALPAEFSGLRNAARETINNYERAAAMAYEWDHHREAISDRLRTRIEIGRAMPHADYVAALRLGEDCRARLPVGVRRRRRAAGAMRQRRGAARARRYRRSGLSGDLDHPPHTRALSAHPSRPERIAGRHPARCGALRRPALLACARWAWQALGTPEMIGTRG